MNGAHMESTDVQSSSSDKEVDDFRYPGPRPLRRDDTQLLVGRDRDVARLVYQIYNYSVVEVTAPSGTGKSSILAAGVIPALENYGFTVVTLRSWAEVRGDQPADYYYQALKRAFLETQVAAGKDPEDQSVWPEDSEAGLVWIEQRFGGSLVVIFDQLEELMRVNAHQAQQFLEQVVRVARESSLRQVLSLRSEFKSQLNVVESQLAIMQWQWYRLEEISDEFLGDVIHAPRLLASRDDDASGAELWPISDDVVRTLVDGWRGAKNHSTSLGLLHLQAALWVLEEQIGDVNTPWTAEAAAGSSFYTNLAGAEKHDAQAKAISSALLLFVKLSLARLERSLNRDAESESLVVPGDEEVTKRKPRRIKPGTETRFAVARFVDDLSSAGYKIPMSVDDLFLKCYEGLQDLRADRPQLSKLRRIWEKANVIGSQDPTDLLRVAVERLPEWQPEGETEPLQLRDRFFSGRLWKDPRHTEDRESAALDALEGLCALEVVFQRALMWLDSRGIVRITPDFSGVKLVTLIHDGFGDALNEWAARAAKEPDYYLRALVGENGTSVLGGARVSGYNDTEDEQFDNSAWALQFSGCSIDRTDFVDVVFDSCDLRGTIFFECRFENVKFRNCYMPGALFIGPQVAGAQGLLFTDTITRTVSIMGGGAVGGAPLVFDGVEAAQGDELAEDQSPGVDGLFLDGYQGEWRIRNSRFRHLSVISCGTGSIKKCDLSLVHVEDLPAPVEVGSSTIRYADSGDTPDGSASLLVARAKK